jgi:hypothetical protein
MMFEVGKRIGPIRAGVSAVCLSLLLSMLTSASVSASSAGGSCKKAGSRSGTVNVPLVCEKVNGKLKWILASGGKCQVAGTLSGTVAKPLVCQVMAGKLRWAAVAVKKVKGKVKLASEGTCQVAGTLSGTVAKPLECQVIAGKLRWATFSVGPGVTSTNPPTVQTTPPSTNAAVIYVPPLERVTNDGLIDFRGSSGRWRDFAVGWMTCAINIDGQTTCRGWDSYGNLGDGGPVKYVMNEEPNSIKTALVVQSEPYVSISAYSNSACAVGQSGQVYCWGLNDHGQLGDGSTRSSPIPIPIRSERRFDSVSIGGGGACGLTVNGEVFCWGRNLLGLLGDAKSRGGFDFRAPQKIVANASFISLSTGDDFACAVATNGDVWCWGASWGNGDPDGLSTSKPFVVRRNAGARLVGAGPKGTCALTATEIDCWGTPLVSGSDFRSGIVGFWEDSLMGCSWTAAEVLCRSWVDQRIDRQPTVRGSSVYFKQKVVKKVESNCALSETGVIACWRNEGGALRPDRPYFLFED